MSRRLWLISFHELHVRLRNPARATDAASSRAAARSPLRPSHARHTPCLLLFSSHPFPLASHLIASSLSSLRRHPDRFALPHCVTIRGTELISTLFHHRGLPTVTRNTVHLLRLRETKKSSPEFPSRHTLSPLSEVQNK